MKANTGTFTQAETEAEEIIGFFACEREAADMQARRSFGSEAVAAMNRRDEMGTLEAMAERVFDEIPDEHAVKSRESMMEALCTVRRFMEDVAGQRGHKVSEREKDVYAEVVRVLESA